MGRSSRPRQVEQFFTIRKIASKKEAQRYGAVRTRKNHQSVKRNCKTSLQMKKCQHTKDGYCIRDKADYCNENECKGCNHKDTSIVVLEIVATCEKTALQCDYCGKIVTKPKTDCR